MRSTEIITLIASALAALVIYPQPAVSGGYAFDTATCSVDAIAFLRIEMQRTHMISVNSRNVVRASRIPSNVQQIINKMLQNLITDYEDPDEQDIVNGYVRDVFGGRQELGTGGTSSFVAEIPLRAARRHVTGNLVLIPNDPAWRTIGFAPFSD